MVAEREPTVRALKIRLNRAEESIQKSKAANLNLLLRMEQVLELFRADMGFADDDPPKKE